MDEDIEAEDNTSEILSFKVLKLWTAPLWLHCAQSHTWDNQKATWHSQKLEGRVNE